MFERKKSIFLQDKWTFLKKIKDMQFDERREEFRKILYAGNFIKFQKSIAIYKMIMERFNDHKIQIKKKNNGFFLALILTMKYKIRI
jgi:hypothetical protein